MWRRQHGTRDETRHEKKKKQETAFIPYESRHSVLREAARTAHVAVRCQRTTSSQQGNTASTVQESKGMEVGEKETSFTEPLGMQVQYWIRRHGKVMFMDVV